MLKTLPTGLALLLIASLVSLVVDSHAQAQQRGQWARTEIKGTLVNVAGNLLYVNAITAKTNYPQDYQGNQVETKPGQYIVALTPRQSQVKVLGSAGPEFIAPRQAAKFTTQIDEKGNIVGTVGQLEVYPPGRDFKPSAEVSLSGVIKFTPDASDDKKTKSLSVDGLVRGFSRGRLAVQVQNGQVLQVPIDKDARVSFTASRLDLASQGDSVTISGQLVEPGKLVAREVTVLLKKKTEEEKAAPADGG